MDSPAFASYEEAAHAGMSVAHAAAEDPARPSVISAHGDRTFGELNARANQLALGFRAAGLEVGDRVALLCRNRPEFVEVYAATARAGLWLTAVNFHLTGPEIAYVVTNCAAKAFVVDASVAAAADAVAAVGDAAQVRLSIGDVAGCQSFEKFAVDEPTADIADPMRGWNMLYTSGTTGKPKGVFRQPPPVGPNISGYVGGHTTHLVTGPLYHAAPLVISLITPLQWGAGVVLMDGWDPEQMLRLVEAHRVTHTHVVPTMLHRLLALPAEVRASSDVSSLAVVVHGAAPCPVPVKRGVIDWLGPIVWEYYAATEGAGTLVDSRTWLERPGTVGRHAEPDGILIVDDQGNPCPSGVEGSVYLKGATDPFEYFGDPEKTAAAHRGHHFTLGDVGYLDADGFLFLTDRSANLIISGGVNIYPAEVDAVLLMHPAVADVAVIGVPDDDMGEQVKAVVEVARGTQPGPALAEELIAFSRANLAHFKCPRTVDFVDHLPREDNGKIYKRRLRDAYRARESTKEA